MVLSLKASNTVVAGQNVIFTLYRCRGDLLHEGLPCRPGQESNHFVFHRFDSHHSQDPTHFLIYMILDLTFIHRFSTSVLCSLTVNYAIPISYVKLGVFAVSDLYQQISVHTLRFCLHDRGNVQLTYLCTNDSRST